MRSLSRTLHQDGYSVYQVEVWKDHMEGRFIFSKDAQDWSVMNNSEGTHNTPAVEAGTDTIKERVAKTDGRPRDERLRMLIEIAAEGVSVTTMPVSTSERITIALAVNEFDALPKPYTSITDAWMRLDTSQRAIVADHNVTFSGSEWQKKPPLYG